MATRCGGRPRCRGWLYQHLLLRGFPLSDARGGQPAREWLRSQGILEPRVRSLLFGLGRPRSEFLLELAAILGVSLDEVYKAAGRNLVAA